MTDERQLQGGRVKADPLPNSKGEGYIPGITIYNGVDSYSRRPIVHREVDPAYTVMTYDDALAVSKKVAAETAHRIGGKSDLPTEYDYSYDNSTFDNTPDVPQPARQRRTAVKAKRAEFEVIHFIIALVLVAVIWFGISAMETKARCEAAPDFVACLMQ